MEVYTEKVLGMFWQIERDRFVYNINYGKFNSEVVSGKRRPTKIEVLRILMSIFDPLGFFSCQVFLIYIKILFQDSIDWDDRIPQ